MPQSKLYFRYGAMNSSKTANLLMVAHNYRSIGKKVILLKPMIDTRNNPIEIISRVGLSEVCDGLLNDEFDFSTLDIANTECILVDECQFLSTRCIDELRKLTQHLPVLCYGLRTDYKMNLFPGSKRLMEVADTIEEIKTVCTMCGKSKAIVNAKIIDNVLITKGTDEPDLGAEEKYQALCWNCWHVEKCQVELNCEVG